MTESDFSGHKRAAVQFLQMVVAGQIEEAYAEYVDMQGKHHNPFFPAGFTALKHGMLENRGRFPDEKILIKNVLEDGSLVAVHAHVIPNPEAKGLATVHIFRFEGDKIVEFWDVGQPMPESSQNGDGMF